MIKSTDMGLNRTGTGTSPVEAKKTAEGAMRAAPSRPGDENDANAIRAQYYRLGVPVGTMPPPASVKGALKAAGKMMKGQKGSVLLDKLGERLAFERTGARLYQLLIAKLDAQPKRAAIPPRMELEEILDDELQHFELVRRALVTMGADPTAMTPCADTSLVASSGILQVLADPRTEIAQCLNAMLIAELTDTAGWALLADLTEAAGQADLAADFRIALENEEKHLIRVRAWLTMLVGEEAGVELPMVTLDGGLEEELTAVDMIEIGQELIEEGASRLSDEE